MFEQFKARAEGVGAEVHRVATRAQALEFLLSLLKQEGVGAGESAVWAGCAFLEGIDPGRLAGVEGLSLSVTREAADKAKVGISEADWALADTGTLVQDQSAVEQRLVSTLPCLHVALIGSSRILADKVALLHRIDPRKSRYLAFITGPSRTADIERVLTIGVHGPKRLVILCIDEPEEAR
jgi:L-lactate dehydrogenase complex protein LldG